MRAVLQVSLTLPDVGTTESVAFGATDGAKTLTVTAQFAAGGGGSFATAVPMNTWNATLFPKHVASESKSPVMATSATLKEHCGFSNCKLSDGEPSPDAPAALYLTTTMTGALAASVEKAGSVVVLLQGTSSGFFQTAATRFKQAWWLGSASDNNAYMQQLSCRLSHTSNRSCCAAARSSTTMPRRSSAGWRPMVTPTRAGSA